MGVGGCGWSRAKVRAQVRRRGKGKGGEGRSGGREHRVAARARVVPGGVGPHKTHVPHEGVSAGGVEARRELLINGP